MFPEEPTKDQKRDTVATKPREIPEQKERGATRKGEGNRTISPPTAGSSELRAPLRSRRRQSTQRGGGRGGRSDGIWGLQATTGRNELTTSRT